MAKNSIREYSTTASDNTDIASIGIQGTNAVNNFDDAFRTIMKQLADMNAGTSPIDDTFSVCDPADATKKVRIDAGTVATATTRVLTMPNANVTISSFLATLLDDADASTVLNTLGVRHSFSSIADDAVGTIDFGGTVTTMMFRFADNNGNGGNFAIRSAASPSIRPMGATSGGTTIASVNTALTGTTGTDGNITIGCDATGKVYIENRSGTSRSFIAWVER